MYKKITGVFVWIFNLFFTPPRVEITGADDPFRESGVSMLPKFVKGLSDFDEALIRNNYRIMFTILTFFKKRVLIRFIPEILLFLLRTLRPYLIFRMMSDFQDPSTTSSFLFFLTFLCMINEMAIAFVEEKNWFGLYFFKREVESTLSYSVYRKSLKVFDLTSSKEKVVNLLSQDCNNVCEPVRFLYLFPSILLRFTTSIVYLFILMRWSALVTVIVLAILLPINFYLISKSYKNYKKRQEVTDERTSLINECIGNIRFIKSFYWEPIYLKKLQEVRNREVKNRKIGAVIWQGVEMLWFTSSFFMSCFTFVFYAAILNGELTPTICFTALTICKSISNPIFHFANSLSNWGKASASMKRLKEFLSLPEVSSSSSISEKKKKKRGNNNNNIQACITEESDEEEEEEEEEELIDLIHSFKKKESKKDVIIGFKNASFTWNSDDIPNYNNNHQQEEGRSQEKEEEEEVKKERKKQKILTDLNFEIKRGEFIAVVGAVASGKSSLASAILGEMNIIEGSRYSHKNNQKLRIKKDQEAEEDGEEFFFGDEEDFEEEEEEDMEKPISYCPQEHWVLSSTIKKNILMGKKYNSSMYKKVLESADLNKDLSTFPRGDRTKIGEKGVTISGGQKARISIARACYHAKESELLIFDDSLKDLDVHVANHVFSEVFLKLLRNRTRVLITHHIQFLSKADRIFVMENGKISRIGTWEELKGIVEEDVKNWEEEKVQKEEDEKQQQQQQQLQKEMNHSDNEEQQQHHIKKTIMSPGTLSSPGTPFSEFCSETTNIGQQISINQLELSTATGLPTPLPMKEGFFDIKLLWRSLLSIYPKTFFLLLVLVLVRAGSEKYRDFFLASWTSSTSDGEDSSIWYYSIMYLIIGIAIAGIVYVTQLVYSIYILSVSQVVHDRLLDKVIKTVVSFFDQTPSGEILSRFTKDLEAIDGEIKWQLREFLFVGGRFVSTMIFIYYFVPIYAVLCIPSYLLLIYVGKRYIQAFIKVARHDSAASISPILSHSNETLNGLVTIRAFKKHGYFLREMKKKLETREIFKIADQKTGIWVCQRGRFFQLCNMFVFCFYAILRRKSIDLSYYGMIFSLLFEIDFDVSWVIMIIPRIQKSLCSLERIDNYQKELVEEQYEGENPGPNFPERGMIEFRNVSFKYDIKNLDQKEDIDELVLKNISFRLEEGERLGIVGRTGSGKSTLLKLLFRLYDLEKDDFDGGDIRIDGINVEELSLPALRTSMIYIAQNPTLISGSIRENLDVRGNQFKDEQLWEVLEMIGLKDRLLKQDHDLKKINVNDIKFSAGEKQLISFSRALLMKKKILILDEASSACDPKTDQKIQRIIKTYFNDCTIFAIAHRLETIMDYTKIMVLKQGRIVQFGRPAELLESKDSLLLDMVKESGGEREKMLKKMAFGDDDDDGEKKKREEIEGEEEDEEVKNMNQFY